MNENTDKCPICKRVADITNDSTRDIFDISCTYCGIFKVSGSFLATQLSSEDLWKLSSAVRIRSDRGEEITLFTTNYKDYIENTTFPDNPIDLIDDLLMILYKRQPKYGEIVPIDSSDYPALRLSDYNQYDAIVSFAKNLGYIKREMQGAVQIELAGWQRLIDLKQQLHDSKKVFVAMWFDPQMQNIWTNYIKPAIIECGYEPVRIDATEYNDDVNDQIHAEIRKAKFVIADFTGNRGGVYFEAGFAKGLGKPVIFTCQEDHFGNVHFDTKHKNYIKWNDLDELKTRLVNRIQATIV